MQSTPLFSQNENMTLLSVNTMKHIRPYDRVKGKSSVEIKAAKNEYESFQVAVIAGGEKHLENVRVKISPLKNGDAVIGEKNISIFREEYVYVRNSTPRPQEAPGLFPDPLLPFINPVTGDSIKPMRQVREASGSHYEGAKYCAALTDIYPGQNNVIWVDVYIPKEAKAGVYKGLLTVSADKNIRATIPVSLTVWDFSLPDTPTHRTHFGSFGSISGHWGVKYDSDKYKAIEMRFCKELARCRISPPIPGYLLPQVNDDGSLTIIPERHKKLQQYIKETHLADFEIPRTKFMSVTSNTTNPTPADQTDPQAIEKTKRYYREYYNYLKENGWDKRAYLYMLDEPNHVKDYQQVINLGKVAKEAAPRLQRLVVEQTYKHKASWPDIDNYVDIWCPLFGYIDRKSINQKIARGDEVWSYTALVQPPPNYHPQYERVKDKNPPYWQIDRPPIVYRIPLWINKQYNIKGLLYWTTTGWYNDKGPWLEPWLGPYPVRYANGGGLLFYPGKEAGFDGPVASIRLKNIREGLEDYEYFAILEKLGQGEFVKNMVDRIAPQWWDFTTDGDSLLKIREKLAQKIVEMR